jgi:hypothetical protein
MRQPPESVSGPRSLKPSWKQRHFGQRPQALLASLRLAPCGASNSSAAEGVRRGDTAESRVAISSVSESLAVQSASLLASAADALLRRQTLTPTTHVHTRASRRRHGDRPRPVKWCTRLSASSSLDVQSVVGVGVTSCASGGVGFGRWMSRAEGPQAVRAAPVASKFAAIVTEAVIQAATGSAGAAAACSGSASASAFAIDSALM